MSKPISVAIAPNAFVAWAKRRHAKDFSRFAARHFPGLPEAVHQASHERPPVKEDSLAIIDAAGNDRMRRDLHAIFAARIRPISWICLAAAIALAYQAVSMSFEHIEALQSVYQQHLLPERTTPPTLSERAAAVRDTAAKKVTEAVSRFKESKQEARESVYENARSDRTP